jgi:hypothetical protein
VARKHLSWYFRQHPGQVALRNRLVLIETPQEQLSTLLEHFDTGVLPRGPGAQLDNKTIDGKSDAPWSLKRNLEREEKPRRPSMAAI